jgi:predicted GNAT superfamily acetyltransferase
MGIKKPICWVDERTHVITFRNDVPIDQARELEPIMRQAFNAGLKHGYRQGLERAQQTQS